MGREGLPFLQTKWKMGKSEYDGSSAEPRMWRDPDKRGIEAVLPTTISPVHDHAVESVLTVSKLQWHTEPDLTTSAS